MKNKGFTLVELLAVIVIITVMLILIAPTVGNIINRSKDTTYQAQIVKILDSAYDLTLMNPDYLPSNTEVSYITLSELKIEGLIESDIKDPKTGDLFKDNLVVGVRYVGNSYKNSDEYSRKNGMYLYTVEKPSLVHDSSKIYPTISLDGLTANSSGNYVERVNIDGEVSNVTYSAKDSNNNDITDRVKIRTTLDDSSVSLIDTTKASIYHIIYTVVDDNGLATSVDRSIIISDIESPTLRIGENTTIATSVTSYNLMTGASCTDNSGTCNIFVEGEIKFGEEGKYIITYTAKDPSGNTTTLSRVITVGDE